MAAVADQQPVKAFDAHGAHPPLGVGVGLRCPRWDLHELDAGGGKHVLEFAWSEFDRGVRAGDRDVAFALIEITDSLLIAEINNRVRERGWDERIVHHYRIAFDDHGRYEIVCTEVTIEEP